VILVDSSIWIDHLRAPDERLGRLLQDDLVVTHPHVIGELALGSLRDRDLMLDLLDQLPQVPLAEDIDVRRMIETRRIHARGIGYSDAHLLASALIDRRAQIWTRDKRLAAVAGELGVAYTPPVN